jgi:hypothetical protein
MLGRAAALFTYHHSHHSDDDKSNASTPVHPSQPTQLPIACVLQYMSSKGQGREGLVRLLQEHTDDGDDECTGVPDDGNDACMGAPTG